MPISLSEWRVGIGRLANWRKDVDLEQVLRSFLKKNKQRLTRLLINTTKAAPYLGDPTQAESDHPPDMPPVSSSARKPGCDAHECPIETPAKNASTVCTVCSCDGGDGRHEQPAIPNPSNLNSAEMEEVHLHSLSVGTTFRSGSSYPSCPNNNQDILTSTGLSHEGTSASEDTVTVTPNTAEMLLIKAGDVELNPGPGPLNHLELYNLAELMDPQDFRRVGLALGFHDAALRRFEHDRGNNILEASYFALVDWLKGIPEAETRATLVGVLRRCQLIQLADKVEKGLVEENLGPLTKDQVKRCNEEIKSFYRTHLCNLQTDPLDALSAVQLQQIYTNLQLLDKGKKGQPTPLAYNELLSPKVCGSGKPKHILVEGEAGVGKTTLCAKIAHDWTSGDGYQEFEMVLVVPLREAEEGKTVGDIVKNYLSDSNPVRPSQINEYILSNPTKVFLIFDGLDEHAGDFMSPSAHQVDQILRGDRYKSVTVLVTSRPWVADKIREDSRLSRIYAYIEVQGFTLPNVIEYILKFFADDEETTAMAFDLIRFMTENEVITTSMAAFPIYTAMLCTMWRAWSDEERMRITKLRTYSQVFHLMILFLIDHYISKSAEDADNEKDKHHQVRARLSQIGRTAFTGLIEKHLSFPPEQFDECQEAMELGCKVGILSRERPFMRRRDTEGMLRDPATAKIVFPHKLFQEYFAGIHLASLYSENREEYENQMAKSLLPRVLEFRNLFYFTVSRGADVGCDIIKQMCSSEGSGYVFDQCREICQSEFPFLVDVAFESQNEEVAKLLDEKMGFFFRAIQIGSTYSPHTLAGFLFIWEHALTLKKLHLCQNNPCGRVMSGDFASIVCTSPLLEEVWLYRARVDSNFFQVMANKASTAKLTKLEVSTNMARDRSACIDLATGVCLLPRLSYFCLFRSDLHRDLYATLASMAARSTIQKLQLGILRPERDWYASRDLARFICGLPNLKELIIERYAANNSFFSTIVELSSGDTSFLPKLATASFSNVNFGNSNAIAVLRVLRNLRELQSVRMSTCGTSAEPSFSLWNWWYGKLSDLVKDINDEGRVSVTVEHGAIKPESNPLVFGER